MVPLMNTYLGLMAVCMIVWHYCALYNTSLISVLSLQVILWTK